jgi:hypothetical protein
VVLSWQALEVQKRLSFAYFSLPLQRKVGAAPHRGNANKPIRTRGRQPRNRKRQRSKKQKSKNQNGD